MIWIEQSPCPGVELYQTSKLENNQAVNILVGGTSSTPELNIILIKFNDTIKAFHNKCSHFGVPLNVLPDYKFFSEDHRSLVCQVHYAKYSPEDGQCQQGDCDGNGLEKVAITIINDKVILG